VMHCARQSGGSVSDGLESLAMSPRVDWMAYWALAVKVWDVAAGQLIVREAGGSLSRPEVLRSNSTDRSS